MKKFSFSLEKVLSYKESVLEKEKGELARLNMQRRELAAEQLRLEEALERESQSFQLKMMRGVSGVELQNFQYIKTAAENQIKSLKQQIIQKDRQIEKQKEVVIEADKDVKKFSKLKEKQVEEYKILEAAEEKENILESLSNKIGRAKTN